MTDLKKFLDIVDENENPMDAPRIDGREGNRDTLRKQIFDYIDDAHVAIDAGDLDKAHEYISYVYELVDDNL
jgi:hypothetical protein